VLKSAGKHTEVIINKRTGTSTVKKTNRRAQARTHRPSPRRVSLLRCLMLTCLLAGAAAPLSAVDPMRLDLAMKLLREPRQPFMIGDVLILSLQPPAASFVGARLDFTGARPAEREGYRVLHTYTLNEHGVYVLDFEVPEGTREVRYRVVVDGLWVSDPRAVGSQMDELGNRISVFPLDREPPRPVMNPKDEEGGRLSFLYRGAPGARVSIAGDFNTWDPFEDFLTEIEPGLYKITLRVARGRHFYYFFSGGRRVLDFFNPSGGMDPDGNEVSSFVYPLPPREIPQPQQAEKQKASPSGHGE
jgi:hypothetical protein